MGTFWFPDANVLVPGCERVETKRLNNVWRNASIAFKELKEG
jgi:hypothetical protein